MTDREMDDLVIFAYSTASARARREQAKAIRHAVRQAAAWLRGRFESHRHTGDTGRLATCAGCER